MFSARRFPALLPLLCALRSLPRNFQPLLRACERGFGGLSFDLALLAVESKISAIELQPVSAQFSDLIDEREESSIMTDDNQPLLPLRDQLVDEIARGQIEVIRRFIENQKNRFFQ